MSLSGNDFTGILLSLLVQSPLYLVWLAGIIIAILNLRNYPKISIFTIIALGIFICKRAVLSVLYWYIPLMCQNYGWTNRNISVFYQISGVLDSFISAFCWGLIIAAVFSNRTAEEYMKSLDR